MQFYYCSSKNIKKLKKYYRVYWQIILMMLMY